MMFPPQVIWRCRAIKGRAAASTVDLLLRVVVEIFHVPSHLSEDAWLAEDDCTGVGLLLVWNLVSSDKHWNDLAEHQNTDHPENHPTNIRDEAKAREQPGNLTTSSCRANQFLPDLSHQTLGAEHRVEPQGKIGAAVTAARVSELTDQRLRVMIKVHWFVKLLPRPVQEVTLVLPSWMDRVFIIFLRSWP